MKHLHVITLTLFSITLLYSGCSVKSDNQLLSPAAKMYQMQITKSAANIKTISISDTDPSNMGKLLANSNVTYKKEDVNGQEVLTKLNGVVATASKKWNLYINDVIIHDQRFDSLNVHPEDKIEWRYE